MKSTIFLVAQALAGLVLAGALTGCATMSPAYEQPIVSLSYFRPAEDHNGFDVGLKILNPNREALNLQGVVYTISVQGQDIVKGVGKNFEPIEGYSEGDIALSAAPNFIAGIRLLSELMNQTDSALEYEFEAKLDVGGFHPRVKVRETGSFDFGQPPAKPK